jgi:hypothetical protein
MRGAKNEALRVLEHYLSELGSSAGDIKHQATLMRRRIIDRFRHSTSLAFSESPLVGRAAAMNLLVAQMMVSRSGASAAVVITGEAGMGKSRLLSEFNQFAILQGFASVRIDCRQSIQTRPLAPFAELVPQLRALPGSIGCSPDNLQFLERLTRHDPNGDEAPILLTDPAWIFSRIQRALYDLIDAVAHETPLLIQVEDIHWLDDASADILNDLLSRPAKRLLFLLTSRSREQTWQRLHKESVQFLNLSALSNEDAQQLISNSIAQSDHAMMQAYIDWCLRVAEGNPYFLIELARRWVETGIEHDVPASLTSVLNERLGRLDRESLQLLQTCALLENNSTLSRIEAVLEYPAARLLESIDSLGLAGMIQANESDSKFGARLLSKHELLSSAAIARLSLPALRFLHRRIGEVLEKEIDKQFSAGTLWDCAKHWQLAGDNLRAYELASACASYLLGVGLPLEASEAYGRVLRYAVTDDQRLDTLRSQTAAFYHMNAWPNVIETASKVRQMEKRLRPQPSYHDDIELMELRAQWQTFDWYGCFKRYLQCLSCKTASPEHRAEAGVRALMLATNLVDVTTTKNIYQTIRNLESLEPLSPAARLQTEMVFHANHGDIDRAVTSAKRLLEQEGNGNLAELFRDLCNAAGVCRIAGDFAESRSLYRRAIEIATSHGLTDAELRAVLPFAHLELEVGNVLEARALYERVIAIPINDSDNLNFVQSRALGVRLALLDGDIDAANRLLPFTLRDVIDEPVLTKRAYNLSLIVAVEIASRAIASRESTSALADTFVAVRTSPHQAFTAFVLYVAMKRGGNTKAATNLLSDYEASYRREKWKAPRHLLSAIEKNATDAHRRNRSTLRSANQ